jgi:hypothetical protein
MIQSEEVDDRRVLILKLSNGETIVGSVAKETQGYIELNNPFKLLMIYEGTSVNLTIIRWDMTVDFNYPVRVFKNTIVSCAKPKEEMVNAYTEIVLSGVDTDEGKYSAENNLQNNEDQMNDLIMHTKKSKLH